MEGPTRLRLLAKITTAPFLSIRVPAKIPERFTDGVRLGAFVGGENDLYNHAMTWREQIAGAFGFGTAPFAMHRSDEDLAKEAIRAAKAEGATREDFAREIALYARKYVSSEGILRERLRQDSEKLEKLWKVGR